MSMHVLEIPKFLYRTDVLRGNCVIYKLRFDTVPMACEAVFFS